MASLGKWIPIAAAIAMSVQASRQEVPNASSAASAFLGALSPALKEKANLEFKEELRTAWAFVPLQRKGVSWKELDEAQRKLGMNLLRSALSDRGIKKVEGVRQMESVLRELEGAHRDPEYYVFTIFGNPADKGAWGWRYEGHHISLNFTYLEGRQISSSPQFFGANPAEVQSGPLKGVRILPEEEDIARELLASLDAEQRASVLAADRAPSDIATSNARKAAIQADAGLAFRSMRANQQALLRRLVEAHAVAHSEPEFKRRLDAIRAAGWDKVKFAWMGSDVKGQGWYYRVQGPTFLIELDNTQNRANHIHAVWRDFKGDFGDDALARHYATAPHHRH